MTEKEKDLVTKSGELGKKAPYRSPQLVAYGDIRELTLTAQKSTNADNAGKDMNMTG
jgi:hypothetical protein